MHRGVILLLFVSFFAIPCYSQQHAMARVNDTLQPAPVFNWNYIHSGFIDASDQVLAPFHWKGMQWLTCAALLSTESALIFAGGDRNIQTWAQANRSNGTNIMERYVGDPFGNGLYPAIIIGSSYIAGTLFHKDRPKRFAMLCAKSFILSGITTEVIKDIAGRHRPFQNSPPNPEEWDGPAGIFNYDSFPSGHTTIAFSTATMVALEYPHPIIIPILAYSLASVTALGRINGNYHWGSDVIMGASIGYFTSLLVYRHNNWGKLQHRIKMLPDGN